jgi:hypothetical protein
VATTIVDRRAASEIGRTGDALNVTGGMPTH